MNVRFYAGLREQIGAAELSVELPPEATAGELLTHLQALYPSAAGLLARSVVAVDREYRRAGDRIALGELGEVAVLPPVSGG